MSFHRSSSHPYMIPSPRNNPDSSLGAIPKKRSLSSTFEVVVKRNSLGLGFSICDSSFPHLIRIKKIFPLQPAWQTGQLKPGDLLLKVNGIDLTGVTVRNALDILRSSPAEARLTVCRIDSDTIVDGGRKLSIIRSCSYTPNIGTNSEPCPTSREPLQPTSPHFIGKFTVQLTKVNGSLGFTLSKSDDFSSRFDSSPLRHRVKALVKEPAKSDGRIKPGDKIITANGEDCDMMSHSELISFLRHCSNLVELEMFRDASRSQTPVSPEEEEEKVNGESPLRRPSSFLRELNAKPKQLRYEAKEMVRSLQASRTSLEKLTSPSGSVASFGSGTHLHRRGLSPHGYRLSKNTSASTVLSNHMDFSEESEPLVETPVTPGKDFKSLPPLYLSQVSYTNTVLIEDVTTPSNEEDTQDVESLFQQLSTLDRPDSLDLENMGFRSNSLDF